MAGDRSIAGRVAGLIPLAPRTGVLGAVNLKRASTREGGWPERKVLKRIWVPNTSGLRVGFLTLGSKVNAK